MRREGLAELMWDEARVARRWSARSAELPPKGCLSRVPFGQVKEQSVKVPRCLVCDRNSNGLQSK